MGRTSWWTRSVAAQDYGPCRVPDLNWAPAYTAFRATACPSYPKVYAAAGASTLYRSLVSYSGMTLRNGSTGPRSRPSRARSAREPTAASARPPSAVSASSGPTAWRPTGWSGPDLARAAQGHRARPAEDQRRTVRRLREHACCSTARRAPRSWCCRRRCASASWTGTSARAPGSAVVAFQTWRTDCRRRRSSRRRYGARSGGAGPKPAEAGTEAGTRPAAKGRYAAYEKITLRLGSTGAPRSRCCRRRSGCGSVDGDFGPRTRAAVIAFEGKRHLTANGTVTTVVWRALG